MTGMTIAEKTAGDKVARRKYLEERSSEELVITVDLAKLYSPLNYKAPST